MSNDVYLIQKQTLDNIASATAEVVQWAGGLTPEQVADKLTAIPRKTGSDCTITGNVVRVPEGLFQDWYDVTVPAATRADTTLEVATNNANSIKITAANNQGTGYVTGANKIAEMTVGLSVVQNKVTMGNNINNILITKTVGTSVAGATYTPTTTDQVLAAGSYLTGAYTIKGDADLIASNIKSGVEIFGVTGTYEGTGGGSYLAAESYTF